ncbi:cupin domain-containing protein [Candidatus Pacearchaeota archaeon]|nr:cupin domain-containing protein [Candidatus Pacearchaeota archaeon]
MKEVKRPWGNFRQFALNKKCTVKIIEVNPMQELSLQVHKKRSEEWYFLTHGFIQMGNKIKSIAKGKIVKIGRGKAHRLFAKSKPVAVLEISYGNFDEKDEIRMEDKYGRK